VGAVPAALCSHASTCILQRLAASRELQLAFATSRRRALEAAPSGLDRSVE
jgi:hypothetical protein